MPRRKIILITSIQYFIYIYVHVLVLKRVNHMNRGLLSIAELQTESKYVKLLDIISPWQNTNQNYN